MSSEPWDFIVGIPIELWAAADTTDEIRDLIRRRDAGEFLPKPALTVDDHARRFPDHRVLTVEAMDRADPVAWLCDWHGSLDGHLRRRA